MVEKQAKLSASRGIWFLTSANAVQNLCIWLPHDISSESDSD